MSVLFVAWSAVFALAAEPLSKRFVNPPDSARPWVYWFWMDGNITKEGITADLEAMQRVGIGGVLIMEITVNQPAGPIPFMSEKWQGMFRHAVDEAARLGLQLTMNAGPGWNGSGGPWITPETSMQLVTISTTKATGPKQVNIALPQPKTEQNYYRDITVLAFPTPASAKVRFPKYDPISSTLYRLENREPEFQKDDYVDLNKIIELKNKMDAGGNLVWDVPEGEWTILRIGHTSKGVMCSPAPPSGDGLECDKLSKKGIEAAFDGMIKKLVEQNRRHVGQITGQTFVRTHIDSWENGTQNWTAQMREEFQKRRGYDIVPFLPVFAGYAVGDYDTMDRFLWDLRRTISEMIYDNYFARLLELAHEHGIGLSAEGYWAPSDQIAFAGLTDEPMGEFWWVGAALETCRGMASSGHIYGKNIIGAEAFTAADDERWLGHPGQMKPLGDAAFCEGINRFVFHRYAMQPWLDRWPGNTMGPYGIHCERTQTWWEQSAAWNRYLSRCQEMLREGSYVADICYLEWEDSPQGFSDHLRLGYGWDQAGTHAVLTRMSVNDQGNIVLPDGKTFRLLVLPNTDRMTPELAGKVEQLVRDGATVIGTKPRRAWGRGVSDSDASSNRTSRDMDQQVRDVGEKIWGTVEGASGEKNYGKGRILWGRTAENVLAEMGVPCDFTADTRLNFLHRRSAGADIYFVVNPTGEAVQATAQFRVTGAVPEFWHPVTGSCETAAMFSEHRGVTIVPMTFEPYQSVFVVFPVNPSNASEKQAVSKNPVVSVFRDDRRIASASLPLYRFLVQRAEYGAVGGSSGDPSEKTDVREFVQQKLDAGTREIVVTDMAKIKDPCPGVRKKLQIEYAYDWAPENTYTLEAFDGESILMNQDTVSVDVKSAKYGILDDETRSFDVTDKLQAMLRRGENHIPVVAFAKERDPATGVTKQIEIKYVQNGSEKTLQLRDGETVVFDVSQRRPAVVRSGFDAEHGPMLEIMQPGKYDMTYADHSKKRVHVESLPEITLDGAWQVGFPVGIPADGHPGQETREFTFEKLISWNEHPDAFVRYFSGTAVYTKTFTISGEMIRPERRLYLDLGNVDVIAEVTLNGKDLGVLWTPVKKIDVTNLLKTGKNNLVVRVTNLWPNKMIGDDRHPEDTERFEDGRPKAWPQWLPDGQPSPTGRELFTAWKLWNRDSKLLPSGMTGPVRIVTTEQVQLFP